MIRATVLLALVSFSQCEFDPELDAKYRSMPLDEFVEYFNNQNYGFKIGVPPELYHSHSACTLFDTESYNKLPQIQHNETAILAVPANFDARQKWPNCQTIQEIYNQGHCGSCWTFGTATVASDRTCIHAGVNVRLAEQDFECMYRNVCAGYQPPKAFEFWRTDGLVTQDCKPYNINKLNMIPGCPQECVNGADYYSDKHFGGEIYSVFEDNDHIMAELFHNGPIEASFMAYDDFKIYTSGIYEHMFGARGGGHSVRVIGYGEENGVQYWLAANSYGQGWGENGLFRVKRFTRDLEFEKRLMAGNPKV